MARARASIRRLTGCASLVAVLVCAPGARAAPTWTAPLSLAPGAFAVAMSPDGTTVYTAEILVSGHERAVVQVRPPGGPVQPLQTLSTPGATVLAAPVVAAAADGTFMVAWPEAGAVQTATMAAGSTTFGDVEALPAAGDTPSGRIAIAVDAAGDGIVLWSSSQLVASTDSSFLRAGIRPASGNNLTAQLIDSDSSSTRLAASYSGLNVAVSAAGDAIAGWQRNVPVSPSNPMTSTMIALRVAGQPFGTAVSRASESAMGASAGPPSVAMNAAGQAAIAFSDRDSVTTFLRYIAATPAGLAPTMQSVASNPTLFGQATSALPNVADPLVAIAPDGRVVYAFTGLVSGVQTIQVASRSAAGVFSPTVQNLTDGVATADQVALTSSAAGEFLASYWTFNAGTYAVGATAAPAGSSQFGAASSPISSASQLNLGGVAASPAGDGVAAWRLISGDTGGAVGYDVSGPQLTGLAVPATGTAGSPLALSVTPVDIWSPIASVSWAFGDGATGGGAAVTHTYASPGPVTASVTATDAAGNVGPTVTAPLTIAPPPVPPPSDTTAPKITRVSLTNASFAVAKGATALSAKAKKHKAKLGTTIRFTLSEVAAVKLVIAHETAGRRKGNACVKPTTALRKHHAKTCVRLVTAGTLTRHGRAGANTVAFSGRLGSKVLARGRYQIAIGATDAAGNTAARPGLKFQIVKP